MLRSALIVVAILGSACGSVKLSARESLTPVLLGPVRHIGPPNLQLAPGNDMLAFRARRDSDASAGPGGQSSSQLNMTIPHGFDLALASLPGGDGARMYSLAPFECEVWQMYMLLAASVSTHCDLRALRYYPASTPLERRFP